MMKQHPSHNPTTSATDRNDTSVTSSHPEHIPIREETMLSLGGKKKSSRSVKAALAAADNRKTTQTKKPTTPTTGRPKTELEQRPQLTRQSPSKRSLFGGLFGGCCSMAEEQVIVGTPPHVVTGQEEEDDGTNYSLEDEEETPFQQEQRKTTQEWLAMLEEKQRKQQQQRRLQEEEAFQDHDDDEQQSGGSTSSSPNHHRLNDNTNKTMETSSTHPLSLHGDDYEPDDHHDRHENGHDHNVDNGDDDFPFEDVAQPRTAPAGTYQPTSPQELQAVFGDLFHMTNESSAAARRDESSRHEDDDDDAYQQQELAARRASSVQVQFQRTVKQQGESELDFVLHQMHLQRKPCPEIHVPANQPNGSTTCLLESPPPSHLGRRASAPFVLTKGETNLVGMAKDDNDERQPITDDEDDDCFQHKTYKMYEDW